MPTQTDVPDIFVKCNRPRSHKKKCPQPIIYHTDLEKNLFVCPNCGFHFTISAHQRLHQLCDPESFQQLYDNIVSADPLHFPGYDKKLADSLSDTGMTSPIIAGEATLQGIPIAIAVTDFRIRAGAMDAAVGEVICLLTEYATEHSLPIILVIGSGGGAAMQNGTLSLMQMPKTVNTLARHKEKGNLYIAVLTHATMGGVLASLASKGSITLAEPEAKIGFVGDRVAGLLGSGAPEDFRTSEGLLKNGGVDEIVDRRQLRDTLAYFLNWDAARSRREMHNVAS